MVTLTTQALATSVSSKTNTKVTKISIPSAGLYMIMAQIRFESGTSTNGAYTQMVLAGDTLQYTPGSYGGSTSQIGLYGNTYIQHCFGFVNATGQQDVYVWIYHNCSSAITVASHGWVVGIRL